MSDVITEYLNQITKRHKTGISREHSYRGDLQNLLTALLPDILTTNEPARVKCGSPDYVLTKKDIPVGYIEAKDLGADLNHKSYNEQFKRYKDSLNNLAFTNYLDFDFYKDGQFLETISLAKLEQGNIIPLNDSFEHFTNLIKNFATAEIRSIKSPKDLASMMANNAKLLAVVIEKALESDEETDENSSLWGQYESFKSILIHDLKIKEFSDIYAQTIAYGMFAARFHDPTLPTFCRREASELIPKTNPFLRKLFGYIAGYDLDKRIVWIIDALADIFRATDVKSLLKDFGKSTRTYDPIIHFYETFLAEYDQSLRKSRGVWYTPEPVVNFIVRAVDDVLKNDFNLSDGLADTTKTKIEVEAHHKGKTIKQEKEVHKVQILDPATGTGTFLAQVIKHIYARFEGMQGIWRGYVENNLIPRLNGFEILMASYAMAHLKLDMLLSETGYKSDNDKRFQIYLTNALEEHHADTGTLFASWLSNEANEANHIKRDAPVMCVIGNPPYSGESANKGEWIMNLMEAYKKEPNSKDKLKERNPKWINDDYVKFIRYGQHFIEKNGEGILAYICPHGFLDNPTFRGMRYNLLQTYDKIYTLDLHGNAKKKETCPDGSKDDNVFDIMQGVSINIFIKTGKKAKKDLAQVLHYDLYGKRQAKYDFLNDNDLKSIPFIELPHKAPMYFMVQKDFDTASGYDKGFAVNDFMPLNSLGIQSHRDSLVFDISDSNLVNRMQLFFNNEISSNDLKRQFQIKENNHWSIEKARNLKKFSLEKIVKCAYRPFDIRYLYNEKSLVDRERDKVMSHHNTIHNNISLLVSKQSAVTTWEHTFVTRNISESCVVSNRTKEGNYTLPLYLSDNGFNRYVNFDHKILEKFIKGLGLKFIPDHLEDTEHGTIGKNAINPLDILDYIYGVLHSPTYREKYKEFLKIDFPKVPYPTDKETFWKLTGLGREIRLYHLLEHEKLTPKNFITSYPADGGNIITTKIGKADWFITDPEKGLGRIMLNETQYFDNIPELAWEFYIGGYQPAQKWLKDRKDRELSYEDIIHYQKIILSLTETHRLMQEIDKIEL